jgi:hypothetical protein
VVLLIIKGKGGDANVKKKKKVQTAVVLAALTFIWTVVRDLIDIIFDR